METDLLVFTFQCPVACWIEVLYRTTGDTQWLASQVQPCAHLSKSIPSSSCEGAACWPAPGRCLSLPSESQTEASAGVWASWAKRRCRVGQGSDHHDTWGNYLAHHLEQLVQQIECQAAMGQSLLQPFGHWDGRDGSHQALALILCTSMSKVSAAKQLWCCASVP